MNMFKMAVIYEAKQYNRAMPLFNELSMSCEVAQNEIAYYHDTKLCRSFNCCLFV